MSRTQWMLAGALALQLLLILAFRSPFSAGSASTEPRLLFPDLEAVTPTRLMLSGGEQDERLELIKSGDRWVVPSLEDFPADALKIADVVGKISSVEVRRPIVSTERYHASFQVEDDEHEARIRIYDDSGDAPLADLILGTSSNYRATHARRAGDERVWEIRGISPWEVRPDSGAWVKKEVVSIDESEVVGLVITNPLGRVELERTESGWANAAAEALVESAIGLRFAEATGLADESAHGFDDPPLTIEIRLADESVTVVFGRNSDDGNSQRYVRVTGSEFAGTVWESTARRFLEATPEGLAGA